MKLPKQIAMLLTITLVTSNGVGALAYTQPRSVNVEKIVGEGRWETAIEVSKNGWTKSEIAIIVNDTSIADALSATPFANQKNAPILLTGKNKLNENTKAELKRLGVKKVYLIGGEDVLPKIIEEHLSLEKIEFERISGEDREKTSLKIAELIDKQKNLSEIAVVNGYKGLADAVSIGAVAAEKNMPIILAHPQNGTQVYDEFISKEDIKTSYVIGGTDTVSQSIENKLPNSKRLGGVDRNETNAKVMENFYNNTILENAYVAKNGMNKEDHLIDALAVGVLAAKNSSPVIIVGNKLSQSQENVIKSKKFEKITQVGGNGNEAAIEEIIKLIKTPSTSQGTGSGGSTGGGTTKPPAQENQQQAPINLVGHAVTGEGKKDGKITGLDKNSIYEYKKLQVEKTTDSYINVELGSEEITNLESGTYYVRFAAKEGYKASEPATVTVGNYIASEPEEKPEEEKTLLQILEEQIKDVLNKIESSINVSGLENIKENISNIENIIKDGISRNELKDLVSNITNLLKEIKNTEIDNNYIENQLPKDLNSIISTLKEIIRTSDKLQQIKNDLEKALLNLNQELIEIINNKKTEIKDFITELEKAVKDQTSEEVKAIISVVENELKEFYKSMSNGVNKEELESVIATLEDAIAKLQDKSQDIAEILKDIEKVFEDMLVGYEKVENVIGKIEQIVDSIENLDTTSAKGFIESALKEVEKILDEKTKEELLNILNKANKVIKTYETFEQTIDSIKQTDNPLEAIKIIATSGLIRKETITQAKELLEYVEEQANNLPDGDLKPVAQLGVTSLKVMVELVEANQTGEGITTVEELIEFVLKSESVTLENMKQARTILVNIENMISEMPDSEIKTQIQEQVNAYKAILDVAIAAGEQEEALNKAIEKAEEALAVLNEALKDLSTVEKIEVAKTALNDFKSTLKTGNTYVDIKLYSTYNDTVNNATKKIAIVEIENSLVILNEALKDLSSEEKIERAKTTLNDFQLKLKTGNYSVDKELKEMYNQYVVEANEKIAEAENVVCIKGKVKSSAPSLNEIAGLSGIIITPKKVIRDLEGNITGYESGQSVTSTDGGSYTLNVEPGEYVIEFAGDSNHKVYTTEPMRLNAGNINLNDIELERLTASLSGTVYEGKLTSTRGGVTVTITNDNGEKIGEGITSSDFWTRGAFRIENIPVGKHTITIKLSDGTTKSEAIEIKNETVAENLILININTFGKSNTSN